MKLKDLGCINYTMQLSEFCLAIKIMMILIENIGIHINVFPFYVAVFEKELKCVPCV